MKTSERGRPLCREEVCTVEITPFEKYCAGHQYMIERWLDKSGDALEKARAKMAAQISESHIVECEGSPL